MGGSRRRATFSLVGGIGGGRFWLAMGIRPLKRPLVVFDGACGFCKLWVERWRARVGDRLDFAPFQEVADQFPEIPLQDFERSVQLIEPDGRRLQRSTAVLRIVRAGGGSAGWFAAVTAGIPGFATAGDAVYRLVAGNRPFFSALTRAFWGNDVRRPTYAISAWLFLRIIAVVFFIAFASMWVQMPGLVGTEGILPAQAFFERVEEAFGPSVYAQLPSLFWFGADDRMLAAASLLGMVLAVAAFAGLLTPLSLFGCWALYLSLCVAGQIFFQYQWDALLLETGWLAALLAPWKLMAFRPGRSPSPILRWLLVWLLFRLMFLSGVVKLASGDPLWQEFAALEVHYLTQPLPTPAAWYADKLPDWSHWLSCAAMFGVELFLPMLFFLPRNLRLLAASGTILLQGAIAITGNYGFFNLLALALCLLLIDDRVWPRLFRDRLVPGDPLPVPVPSPRRVATTSLRLALASAYVLLSLPPLARAFEVRMPAWVETVSRPIAPFRSVNGYGLFAVMTRERNEILVEGSLDGRTWKAYRFRYKPGPLDEAPRWAGAYLPRLDWQMWFAALSSFERTPWFHEFLRALLEGRAPVLGLLEENPFPDEPPRFIRAKLDRYTFSTFEQLDRSGQWWDREALRFYSPEVQLRDRKRR